MAGARRHLDAVDKCVGVLDEDERWWCPVVVPAPRGCEQAGAAPRNAQQVPRPLRHAASFSRPGGVSGGAVEASTVNTALAPRGLGMRGVGRTSLSFDTCAAALPEETARFVYSVARRGPPSLDGPPSL